MATYYLQWMHTALLQHGSKAMQHLTTNVKVNATFRVFAPVYLAVIKPNSPCLMGTEAVIHGRNKPAETTVTSLSELSS